VSHSQAIHSRCAIARLRLAAHRALRALVERRALARVDAPAAERAELLRAIDLGGEQLDAHRRVRRAGVHRRLLAVADDVQHVGDQPLPAELREHVLALGRGEIAAHEMACPQGGGESIFRQCPAPGEEVARRDSAVWLEPPARRFLAESFRVPGARSGAGRDGPEA